MKKMLAIAITTSLLTLGCSESKKREKLPHEHADWNLAIHATKIKSKHESWRDRKCEPITAPSETSVKCTVDVYEEYGGMYGMRRLSYKCSTTPDSWCIPLGNYR